jgi:hypothetical protein
MRGDAHSSSAQRTVANHEVAEPEDIGQVAAFARPRPRRLSGIC